MKLIIDIPKEFENHFGWDRFAESFDRIYNDIEHDIRLDIDHVLSGNHELETIEMLKNAFKSAEIKS